MTRRHLGEPNQCGLLLVSMNRVFFCDPDGECNPLEHEKYHALKVIRDHKVAGSQSHSGPLGQERVTEEVGS